MWMKNGLMYGWYKNNTFITFENGKYYNSIADDGIHSRLFGQGSNWTFALGDIPVVYTNWVKDNIV